MGKSGKNHKQPRPRRFVGSKSSASPEDDALPSSAYDPPPHSPDHHHSSDPEPDDRDLDPEEGPDIDVPSKFHLYQRSVQSPKGDISYLLKFFMIYVGGRVPIHLQEDFCGTALLSTEWIRSDPRRTAVGLDLDLEALTWCFENNLTKVGSDGYSQIKLFHGDVLQPHEACLVRCSIEDLVTSITFEGEDLNDAKPLKVPFSFASTFPGVVAKETTKMKNCLLPSRDIVCAFNYSCCCLHKRSELILYFRHALDVLDKKGGIFVMDVYGGASSEQKLQLRRRFSNFTYIWDQADFDVITRKTNISIHFHPRKKQILRHVFSYDWRLWSLPEIKDCMEEAGFQSVHFWIREMPDTQDSANVEEFNASSDVKYEELLTFLQRDAWNAYAVGVKK